MCYWYGLVQCKDPKTETSLLRSYVLGCCCIARSIDSVSDLHSPHLFIRCVTPCLLHTRDESSYDSKLLELQLAESWFHAVRLGLCYRWSCTGITCICVRSRTCEEVSYMTANVTTFEERRATNCYSRASTKIASSFEHRIYIYTDVSTPITK
jgi:hypothetical protein